MAFAEWLHTTVPWPVAHRQIVLTIPKMPRAYFRNDRRLLGDLSRVAAEVLVSSFCVLLDQPEVEPGLVVCVHSFGNLLNFHPHLHVMATDGGFTPDGVFPPLPTMSLASLEQLFRHRVFKMLLRKGLLIPQRIKLMKFWEHSGYVAFKPLPPPDEAPHAKVARASWARFIKKVFAADPLECPNCGGATTPIVQAAVSCWGKGTCETLDKNRSLPEASVPQADPSEPEFLQRGEGVRDTDPEGATSSIHSRAPGQGPREQRSSTRTTHEKCFRGTREAKNRRGGTMESKSLGWFSSRSVLLIAIVGSVCSLPLSAWGATIPTCSGPTISSNPLVTPVLPWSLDVDAAKCVLFAERENNRVLKICPNDAAPKLVRPAGHADGLSGFSGDGGKSYQARLNFAHGVGVDTKGNFFVADYGNRRIRKVTKTCTISTVAGSGVQSDPGDGGQATQAILYSPAGVVVSANGTIYIDEYSTFRIRKVDVAGIITTAVTGLNGPLDVAVDKSGDLYIADTYNCRVVKVDTLGQLTTVAGTGTCGYTLDVPAVGATAAMLYWPDGIGLDKEGNLYIADTGNHLIRKVENGMITTVAGNYNTRTPGYCGEGPALFTCLSWPTDVAVDVDGKVYIADQGNRRLRRVTGGVIDTVAGDGQ